MTIEITSLETLNNDDVQQAFEYLETLLVEKYPNIDSRRGVIGDLTLRLEALLYQTARQNIQRLQASGSLLKISADPTLADDALVDQVLSNYRITRREPSFARGEITIVLDRQASVTIPATAIFEANGQQYQADAAYAARTSEVNVLSDTDRLLVQVGDERFAFTINVVALTAGPAAQAKKDDKFIPLTAPLGFVKAYATNDFSTAAAVETNSELLSRLEEGAAAKALSNRITSTAMIKAAPAEGHALAHADFANILAVSIIGAGDAEMQRDQHWLFPVSGGGKCDYYVKSQPLYSKVAIDVTATLIQRTADGGVWQFSLTREDAPGAYEILRVNKESNDENESGYTVIEHIRGVDLTGDVYLPDIESAQEAAFSRFQALTVRFLDTDTLVSDLAIGTTGSYVATAAVMPLVEELQVFLGDRSVTDPVGDVLVKAAIPCFLDVSFELHRRRTTVTIDTAAIASAVANYVNSTGFPGKLYASDLSKIVANLLPDRVSVGSIDMLGRIVRPDGETSYIRSSEVLTVPEIASAYVSGRTVAFFLDTSSVAISVVADDVPEV